MLRQSPSEERVLSGIRVVEVASYLAGPYVGRHMSDLGAEVIKVEQPGVGDPSRTFPWVKNGESGYFIQANCGKKSLCLDLRQPLGAKTFKDLILHADVLVEALPPGDISTFGLDYDVLKRINNRLIMCSISGFGRTGPWSDRLSADVVAQAVSGIMAMTGEADGPPQRVGLAIGDVAAASHALTAVCSALYYRERTGIGQFIDISMMDCCFGMHEVSVQSYVLSEGKARMTRYGNHHPTAVPFDTFKGRDGYVVVACANNAAWARLCEAMGQPQLAHDPRFATLADRVLNREQVAQAISLWIDTFDSIHQVIPLLEEARILTTPVLTVAEVADSVQIAARNMLVPVDHPRLGQTRIVNSPYRFSETRSGLRGVAPALGEQTREVLSELLGYSNENIDALKEVGAIP